MSLPVFVLGLEPFAGTVHLPMIAVEFLPISIDLEGIQILLFSSKNAVRALEASGVAWHHLACAAIGEATAEEIRTKGARVIYTASKSYAEEFALELMEKIGPRCYGIVRAEETAVDLAALLRAQNAAVREFIVYRTQCTRSEAVLPDKALFVFTSPSTVHCFMQQFGWRSGWRAVAIGKRTASSFGTEILVTISPKTTLESAVSSAFSLMGTSHNPL